MTKTNARIFLIVCLAILVVGCGHGKGIPPEGADHAEGHVLARADFQAGVDAAKRGDHGTALKEFRRLAEQRPASAQYNLGYIYEYGQGVPQDYQEAMKWWRLAADQGVADAQNNLGYMFFKGQGVQRNYDRAYMWITLAAAQGNEKAAKGLQILEQEMTPAQITEAQRLAREWKAKGK